MSNKLTMYYAETLIPFYTDGLPAKGQPVYLVSDILGGGYVGNVLSEALSPIHMILWCPACGARHIDKGSFATKPHHTHACQYCGVVWRPALVDTVGVEFLPGFKDE